MGGGLEEERPSAWQETPSKGVDARGRILMSLICPRCHNTNNLANDRYCYKDGERLITPTPCSSCGREVMSFMSYCPGCGEPVDKQLVEAANKKSS